MTRHSQDDSTQQKSSGAGDSPLHAWNAKLIEPGLEVAPVTDHDKQYINPVHEGDKEAYDQDKKEVVTSQGYQIAPSQVQAEEASFKHRKLCGLRRRWFWTLLVAALLLMALIIGLAVGLSSRAPSKSSDSTQTAPSASPTPDEPSTTPSSDSLKIGGSVDPSWFSGSGAWNGTGSAFTWQEFAEDFDDDIADQVYDKVLYYQHHTGEIRWMRLTANDTQAWQQGPPDSEVASDAKNSTPISTVTMRWSTSMWHVFYIDSEYQVRHRKGSNRSTAWDEGTTREANLKAWDGDLVGMTACWGTGNDNPIRLFYASSNSTFEEYLWNMQDDTWRRQQSWEGFNGAAAVRCYIGSVKNTDRGANRYLILMNSDNQIEFWYQNKDDGSQDWRKSKLRIDNAHPASSLGLTDNVIVWQEASTNLIKVKRIDWQGENTRTTDDFSPGEQYAGIAGTQLEVVTYDNFTHIFYQRTGNDLTRLYRESYLGLSSTWESMEMPV